MPRQRRLPVLVLIIAGLMPSLAYAWSIWRRYPAHLLSESGALVVGDYVNLWAVGSLALAGGLDVVFDPTAYQAWMEGVFGSSLDQYLFAYPPTMLVLALPFGLLPLVPGFFVWTVVSLAALAAALRAAGLPIVMVAAILVSPAAAENLVTGQTGSLIAAALAGGLLMARAGRPVAAGLLLGLLVLKPQFGLLVPVCLLAARDWRATLCTGAAAVFYVAATLPVFGVDAWRAHSDGSGAFIVAQLQAPFGLAFQYEMPSPFMSLRALGLGLAASYVVQAVVTLGCMLLVAGAWWPRARPGVAHTDAVALALLLTPMATPYGHAYDLVVTAVGIALLAPAALASEAPSGWYWRRALAIAWLWPGMAMLVGTMLLPGLAPLVLAPAMAYAALRAFGMVETGSTEAGDTGAVEKIRTSTGLPLPAPQAGASTIPPRPQTG